jgi:hypothetical protein
MESDALTLKASAGTNVSSTFFNFNYFHCLADELLYQLFSADKNIKEPQFFLQSSTTNLSSRTQSNFYDKVACGTGIKLSGTGMKNGESYWLVANVTQTGWLVTINGQVCPNKRRFRSHKGAKILLFTIFQFSFIAT